MQVLAASTVLLSALFAVAGILFCALAMWSARAFLRASRRSPSEHPAPPSISILKPVKGIDDGLRAALRTHCTQDYPAAIELLFAVHSLEDPAVPTLRALAAEFPALRIEVVATPLVLGTNGKMSNLAQLLPHARHELILISDADIAVGPRYLRRIAAPFLEPTTGLVTALYRGRTHPVERPTLGSRLEALSIATDFAAGVLTARFTDRGLHFGLGSTLLVSRRALAAAGGLEVLCSVLADDHDLGAHVSRAGFRVILSPEPVSTAVPAYSFRDFWLHQLRWARTVRAVRAWSYGGLVFTHPVPWALLCLVASGGSLFSVLLLVLALLARMAVALLIGYSLVGDRAVLRDLVLLPLRDCLALALWAWSFAGNTVEWRGERFRIEAGKLLRIPSRHAGKQPTAPTAIQ
ncbi:bacteriohopanetetrol glucosamine biosynthesis glycosyltransferase HpnI [Acidipila sp. EB88]|uniref:bacteriohopanetetrol glucosamine biosynthesis glycosyltransferase HpnI n=1 Tax=Acidipila sp. EB88 TaxID=2305226 RepID=UPI001F1E0FCB|nr:bacteriohopanetetrol glucosamine biosynthesis glycosyltransferase HpnI [Acidipila sp. EB88]